MTDYIPRKAALSAQNKSMNLSECRKRLERIPAADVRPVMRGKWIFKETFCGLNRHECSECGGYVFRMSNYCPNCGARMDV